MSINKIIGVIGDASIKNEEEYKLAYEIGKRIIDEGFILATGGLGGVMEAASKGASESTSNDGKSIIAVLPDNNSESANIYANIILPLGTGIRRNIDLISMCSAVIAIGGGAGTLCEISTAWQMGKLIVALGNYGQSGKLKNQRLDDRRQDIIFGADCVEDAILILKNTLQNYQKTFSGISVNFTPDYALKIINSKYPESELSVIGKGKSGIVVGNKHEIFKIFFDSSFELYSYLKSISQKLAFSGIDFEIESINKKTVLKSDLFGIPLLKCNKLFDEDDFINALNDYYNTGIITTDIKPENFIYTEKKGLIFFDIDKDIIPYTEEMFEVMAREFFAIYKMQEYLKLNQNLKFKKIIGSLQQEENFSAIGKLLNISEQELKKEYTHFRFRCGQYAIYKNLIYKYFDSKIISGSLFDYGAGTLEIAHNLKKRNYSVAAYDIDTKAFKDKYSEGIDCFTDVKKLNDYLENKKYDTVLCSLVLCCVEDNIAKHIVNNCKKLATNRIIFIICNPLSAKNKSTIQDRNFNHNYSDFNIFTKCMKSTKNIRTEYHRPLSFYENLFIDCDNSTENFEIEEIIQSSDSTSNFLQICNSDFMLISLKKRGY